VTVEFSIAFHGTFRVGTGYGRAGADESYDPDDPLPASSLKGVMRAAAEQLLDLPAGVVEQVYGGPRQPSPWSWSSARLDGPPTVPHLRVRIHIDDLTHTAKEDFLLACHETHATSASFQVRQSGFLADADRARHKLVLACSGQAVTAIGSDRRRGLGWVTVRCVTVPVDRDAVSRLTELRGQGA